MKREAETEGESVRHQKEHCAGYLRYPFYKNALMMATLRSFPTYPHNEQSFPQSSLLACFGTNILSSRYKDLESK